MTDKCRCANCGGELDSRDLVKAMMVNLGATQATDVRHGKIRCSDAARDVACAELRTAYAEGRLTQEVFDARLSLALVAVTEDELATLTHDLPASLILKSTAPALPPMLLALGQAAILLGVWAAATCTGTWCLGEAITHGGFTHQADHWPGIQAIIGVIVVAIVIGTARTIIGSALDRITAAARRR